MSAPVILPATPEHIPAISALYGDLYRLLASMNFPFTLEEADLADVLKVFMRSKLCCLAVAQQNGSVCGFIAASINRLDRKLSVDGARLMGKINDICVSPEYRGTGLSDQLLLYAEGWLREQEISLVESEVILENRRSLRWFERHGYLPFCHLTYKKLGG